MFKMLLLSICVVFVVFKSISGLDYSCIHAASWRLNTDGDTNVHFSNAKTEILSSALSGTNWVVQTNGIPKLGKRFISFFLHAAEIINLFRS